MITPTSKIDAALTQHEADRGSVVKALENALDYVSRVSGAALGLAMSGANHPNWDGVLMDYSREGMTLAGTLRAALASEGAAAMPVAGSPVSEAPGEVSKRPERLWLGAPNEDNEHAVWFDTGEGGTMYVRADLAQPTPPASEAMVGQAHHDAAMYGVGYLQVLPDGSMQRLYPQSVVLNDEAALSQSAPGSDKEGL